jgi:hypothetical protein
MMSTRGMGTDLRYLIGERLIVHPRLKQQQLYTARSEIERLVADLPPLVPFQHAQAVGGNGGNVRYQDADWILDWDHRLPSRNAILRLGAYYSTGRRDEARAVIDQKQAEIARADLFPEFDVADFGGIPGDEVYEAEMEIGSPPARLRLVSEWRREVDPVSAERAVAIVRASQSFKEIQARTAIRPPGLGDLEAAEWTPPCESGHARWGIDVWYLLTYNGMVGEGRAFLVDHHEGLVIRERDFQFRAG